MRKVYTFVKNKRNSRALDYNNTENIHTAINGCLHSQQFEDVDTLNTQCYIYFSCVMSWIFL